MPFLPILAGAAKLLGGTAIGKAVGSAIGKVAGKITGSTIGRVGGSVIRATAPVIQAAARNPVIRTTAGVATSVGVTAGVTKVMNSAQLRTQVRAILEQAGEDPNVRDGDFVELIESGKLTLDAMRDELLGHSRAGTALVRRGTGMVQGTGPVALITDVEVYEGYRAPKGYSVVTDPETGQKIAMLTVAARKLGLVGGRRMNVLNSRALGRANRRMKGFTKVAKRTLGQLGFTVQRRGAGGRAKGRKR